MGDPEQVTSRPVGVGEPGQVPGRRGPARLPAPPCAAHLRVELSGRNSCACTDRAPRAATPRTAGAAGGRLRLAGESEVAVAAAPALLDRTETPTAARVGPRTARRVAASASEPLTVATRLVADRRSQAPAGTAAAVAATVRVREPDAGAGARARARRRRKRARSS
ncbi:hypothetical protein PAL_GLEAN10006703 [Pteropus alecto]|uniref:Uncharacterized protein n=1 Tax=Pteropus alecto TaxID=9402 RepID=L5L6D7_PTEAL|nr:hypothetical protein PAL_GLEAN10006703 [Pteropus alecto]